MDGNAMGEEIAVAIMPKDTPPEVRAAVIALWGKIGTAIADHIKKNAIIPSGIAVSTSGGGGSTTGTGQVI
jgi:predicted KAP-like P-loop ATPase